MSTSIASATFKVLLTSTSPSSPIGSEIILAPGGMTAKLIERMAEPVVFGRVDSWFRRRSPSASLARVDTDAGTGADPRADLMP